MNEEEIETREELASKLSITEEKLNRLKISNSPNQPGRFDKQVVAAKANQTGEKNVSKIFLGKNQQQGLALKDGTYVNAEELKDAIHKELEKETKENKKIIVSKKGKKVNIEEIKQLLNELNQIILSEGSSKINQFNYSQSIKINGTTYSKGNTWGFKDQLIPTGNYVNINEVMEALNDYMLITKKEPIPPKPPTPQPIPPKPPTPQPIPPRPIPPRPIPPQRKNYTIKVKKKYKNKAAKWLVGLGITATLLSGFKMKDKTEFQIETRQQPITTTKEINEQDLKYIVEHLKNSGLSEEQIQQILYENINLGDNFKLHNGLELYYSSILNKNNGTIFIGNAPFQEGEYRITGFSIIHNNEMIQFVEAYNNEDVNINLKEYIENTLQKYNLNLNDVKIRVHFGSNIDNTRAGWCDVSDIFNSELITSNKIENIAKEKSTIKGEIDNFEGDTITITTEHGEVKIPVKDKNGNFYNENTKVIGSDGQEYTIAKLDITNNTKTISETSYETITETKEVITGKKLTWNIIDCKYQILIISLLGALASQIAINKENKKSKPIFEQIDNEEEYEKFKQDFINAKNEYEKKSKFTRKIKELFYKKRIDTMQLLTSNQIKQIYNIIKNLNTPEYTYQTGDTILLKNGRIIIKNKLTQKDITDLIIDKIKNIGKNNEIEAIGLTDKIDPEEIENGIRRR